MPVPPIKIMAFYRRNLPHWHPPGKTIFITWRLYGSLPASVLKKKRRPTNAFSVTETSPVEDLLDFDSMLESANRRPLWLSDPELADYAEYPILRGAERGRFLLHVYVIMPNHVHVLLDPHIPLAKISGPIKGVSACDINSRLGRTGKPLWQDESFDHWIRNSAEFERIRSYIESYSVAARLVREPADWKWSSAGNPYFKRLSAAQYGIH